MFWIAFAVVLGGIVHVAAMLVIPALSPKSGYGRYEATIEANTPIVAGPARPNASPFPFASPDVVYVMCRYDVTERPLRFTASLPDTYWSLAVYEPDGGNFFHMNSVQAPGDNADLVLLGGSDEFEPGDTTAVARATHPRGLVVFRAFLRDRTMAEGIKAAAKATCGSLDIE